MTPTETSYAIKTKICTNKKCPFTGTPQPIDQFPPKNQSWCKTCNRECIKQWKINNPALAREVDRRSRFKARASNREKYRVLSTVKRMRRQGVTMEWYEQELIKQNCKCAICGEFRPLGSPIRLAVDHNHKCCPKGKACEKCRRALLCGQCNTRLGHLEDIEWLEKAVAYLARFH